MTHEEFSELHEKFRPPEGHLVLFFASVLGSAGFKEMGFAIISEYTQCPESLNLAAVKFFVLFCYLFPVINPAELKSSMSQASAEVIPVGI